MGSKMRHDAVKLVLARAFKQAGFEVCLEQGGGLLDRRRPGDIEVKDWVVVSNWNNNKASTSLHYSNFLLLEIVLSTKKN